MFLYLFSSLKLTKWAKYWPFPEKQTPVIGFWRMPHVQTKSTKPGVQHCDDNFLVSFFLCRGTTGSRGETGVLALKHVEVVRLLEWGSVSVHHGKELLFENSFSELVTESPGPILIKQQQLCYLLTASPMALLNLSKLRLLKKWRQ